MPSGESLGGYIMKQPKISGLKFDRKGTESVRSRMEKNKKVKITINIDQASLESLRKIASQSGASIVRG